MTLDSDLGIKNFDRAIPIWEFQKKIHPLTEITERVDGFKGVILSSDHAKAGTIFFIGVFLGDLCGFILSGLTAIQKV